MTVPALIPWEDPITLPEQQPADPHRGYPRDEEELRAQRSAAKAEAADGKTTRLSATDLLPTEEGFLAASRHTFTVTDTWHTAWRQGTLDDSGRALVMSVMGHCQGSSMHPALTVSIVEPGHTSYLLVRDDVAVSFDRDDSGQVVWLTLESPPGDTAPR